MSKPLTVHIGRANRQRLRLEQDGEIVTPAAVTRAQFKFGPYCLDTAGADPIALTDSATVVEMQAGLTPELKAGVYQGKLTIFDNLHPEGIAWASASVIVKPWQGCE
jgi:hypothetical protein